MQFTSRERAQACVRPVDGLVVAMAHLWSKFTKCLRPSEGASDPRSLPSPNVGSSSAQCRVIRYYYTVAITTSRKQRGLPPPLQPSFARSSALFVPRSSAAFLFFYDLSQQPGRAFAQIMNITLITKYRPLRLSIFRRRDTLSFIYESSSTERDRRKTPGELIAVRYPTKYTSAYNWILFMDFIQNVYRCINYKKACPGVRARRSAPSPFDSRDRPGLPLLSS